jgi:hypothetical protein
LSQPFESTPSSLGTTSIEEASVEFIVKTSNSIPVEIAQRAPSPGKASIEEITVESIKPSPSLGITTIEEIAVESVNHSPSLEIITIEEISVESINHSSSLGIATNDEISVESINNSPSLGPTAINDITIESIEKASKSIPVYSTPIKQHDDTFLAISECDKSITVRRKKNRYSLAVNLVSSDNDIENFQVCVLYFMIDSVVEEESFEEEKEFATCASCCFF